MKTKLFFVVFLFAFLGCKEKKSIVVEAPKPDKITQHAFILGLAERADVKNQKADNVIIVKIDTSKVKSPSAKFAIVRALKDSCSYDYLKGKLKQVFLTAVWVGNPNGGSDLLIKNYTDLRKNYRPGENFFIRQPKPTQVEIGDSTFWISKDGKFWGTP